MLERFWRPGETTIREAGLAATCAAPAAWLVIPGSDASLLEGNRSGVPLADALLLHRDATEPRLQILVVELKSGAGHPTHAAEALTQVENVAAIVSKDWHGAPCMAGLVVGHHSVPCDVKAQKDDLFSAYGLQVEFGNNDNGPLDVTPYLRRCRTVMVTALRSKAQQLLPPLATQTGRRIRAPRPR